MVSRIAFLVGFIALLITACGGSANTPAATIASDSTGAGVPTDTPAGPRAVVEPSSGPPGTEITVRGSGWEPGALIDVTGELAPGSSAAPYETVVSNADGTFSASFRLERTPDGVDLSTGRYNLIARSVSTQVSIPFLVETRRPVGSTGPTG